MSRWVKQFGYALGFVSITACAGGSQGPAVGCTGVTPLPAGYESERIENSAALRVTDTGLSFLEKNISTIATAMLGAQGMAKNGVIEFPVPKTPVSQLGNDGYMCPDGPDPATGTCMAEIDLKNATVDISTKQDHDIVLVGPIPIRLKNLPIKGSYLLLPINLNAALSGDTGCDVNKMTFREITVNAQLAIEVERNVSHTSRLGYSKVSIVDVKIDETALINGLHFCGSFQASVVNLLKGWILPSLVGTITAQLKDTANAFLCQPANPLNTPSCPNGSFEVKDDPSSTNPGVCRYGKSKADACVSIMLGTDGHADLGAVLASVSPGIKGGMDFLMAAGGPSARPDKPSMGWGDLNPVGGGLTLGLFGGTSPLPISDCVKPVKAQAPPVYPIPAELYGNKLSGWNGEGPHAGVGLSEGFINYALVGAYNSGALCIGMSTDQAPMLSTGLFSLLVPSIKALSFQKQPDPANAPAYQRSGAQLGIVIRPQKQPTVQLGNGTNLENDPLILIALDQALIDFYVWANERFIRAFTAQFDLKIPVNIEVSAGGITPKIDKIFVENPLITNSDLLRDEPSKIASSLASIIQGLAGQFIGSALPTVDLSAILAPYGISLNLQQSGIRKLQADDGKGGTYNFLGFFVGFAPVTTKSLQTDTSLSLVSKTMVAEGFRLSTLNDANRPKAIVRVESSMNNGRHAIEYSYKLDKGLWHSWKTAREFVVDDPFLAMQGRHELFVTSRIVGQPTSEDPSPARLEIVSDVEPPVVALLHDKANDRVVVSGQDFVSSRAKLKLRYRFDQNAMSAWTNLAELGKGLPVPSSAKALSVEVVDEEGNLSTSRLELVSAEKEVAPQQGEAGIGCSTSRVQGGRNWGIWAAIAVLGAVALRREKRRMNIDRRSSLLSVLGGLLSVSVFGSFSGCTCSSSTETDDPPVDIPVSDGGKACGTPTTKPCVVLEPGIIGTYTSVAVANDGTVWVAGYNEADWDNKTQYGDLVVGKWDSAKQAVDWKQVDGLPDTPVKAEDYDITAWRGGQGAPGFDVGTWTSIALDAANNPHVVYVDETHWSLKYARFDGSSWKVSVVMAKAGAQVGRYAKLAMIAGKPVIAFQVIEMGNSGFAKSSVIVAKSTSGQPSAESDWAFETVASNVNTPCRASLCSLDQACVASTQQCAATSQGCNPTCETGKACILDKCELILDATKIDAYPAAIGDNLAMAIASDGIGLVYYDRLGGDLVQLRQAAGKWQAPVILDGQAAGTPPIDTGNVGSGASLFIDAKGDWHVSYVSLDTKGLRYMLVSGGTQATAFEVVDDGVGLTGTAFPDGHHWLDDSNIVVSPSGEIRIAYQDGTSGQLRLAVGAAKGGGGHAWSVKAIAQDGFAGFFPHQIGDGASARIVNWWRKGGSKVQGDVRILGLN